MLFEFTLLSKYRFQKIQAKRLVSSWGPDCWLRSIDICNFISIGVTAITMMRLWMCPIQAIQMSALWSDLHWYWYIWLKLNIKSFLLWQKNIVAFVDGKHAPNGICPYAISYWFIIRCLVITQTAWPSVLLTNLSCVFLIVCATLGLSAVVWALYAKCFRKLIQRWE